MIATIGWSVSAASVSALPSTLGPEKDDEKLRVVEYFSATISDPPYQQHVLNRVCV